MIGFLQLENGIVFQGDSFGFEDNINNINNNHNGEIVFQTGMVGYPESLTDPSYNSQILVLTYPLIGNYGIPDFNEIDQYGLIKHFESDTIQVKGLIVGEYNDKYNHWNSYTSLSEWLKINLIPGLTGIDTRYLTKIIREKGVMKGRIIFNKDILNDSICNIEIDNLPLPKSDIQFFNSNSNSNSKTVLVIDCGIKVSQIREFLKRDVNVIKIPWNYNFNSDNKKINFDGIFLSNGPLNPTNYTDLINNLKIFIENNQKPIFGICLGHQILALAAGFKTYKMKYGNRGHNVPCQFIYKSKPTKRAVITSQNHGYAVDLNSSNEWLPLFVNANDNSNEGMIHKNMPYFSVQFHPEARAGPEDTKFLFDIFINSINNNNNKEIKIIDEIYNNLISNENENKNKNKNKIKKILILGSGGLSIGQAGEFDYSGSQAIKAYREEGIETILINPNIATIQTSTNIVDKIYYLPITTHYVKQVIDIESPDAIALSFGGQIALNCGIELDKNDYFKSKNIKVLGTSIKNIINTEDRKKFKNVVESIGESIAPCYTTDNLNDAIIGANKIGYPVLVRCGFALGGLGSGFVNNDMELTELIDKIISINSNIIIDKSLKGWKEIEYEIIRDQYDNCLAICNMENIDPLGIHTGESMVVAPSQTLNDIEYNMLRTVGIKMARCLNIVGECNIQYALNPHNQQYYIIEINARLSRSSALASKATGYPLAYIAAKLSLGYSLLDIKNSVTKSTTACFEPSMDYCVIKIPRWDLNKFPMVNHKIGSSMKSIGEVMAISRNFEEAFQKALRMTNDHILGFDPFLIGVEEITEDMLENPSYDRIFAIASAMYNNKFDINKIYDLTKINTWFLKKFLEIIKMYWKLYSSKDNINKDILLNAKKIGFSDIQIAQTIDNTPLLIRNLRKEYKIIPIIKQIDTVAGEFPCNTNYLYMTYNGNFNDIISNEISNEISNDNYNYNNDTIIVLGSGVYRIGSSVEFDWCAVNCVKTLRKFNKKTIMINYNPETVSTDYDEADKLYFEEINLERVLDIYEFEKPSGIILCMGGQISNNIAIPLHEQGVKIIGTQPDMIDLAENRYKFSRLLDELKIDQPKWSQLSNFVETQKFCHEVNYPCLVRPSYVLSGAAMRVVYNDNDLEKYLGFNDRHHNIKISKDFPVVISKFILNAKEIEVDAVSNNGDIVTYAISEHVENAGVHSGDATLVLPSKKLNNITLQNIDKVVKSIAKSLEINGPFNIQFIVKNNNIKVIECNLRVSRSFPFVSKTLNHNFIDLATKIMIGKNQFIQSLPPIHSNQIGIKVPIFSFNRLQDADSKLGVEMMSTGEVAGFGENEYIAYLKALQSSGFILPKINGNILISIGGDEYKKEFLKFVKMLENKNYHLYGTLGTANFYSENGIVISSLNKEEIFNVITKKRIDLIIITSYKNYNGKYNNESITDGYKIRRLAIDYGISIITDIKCSKLFVESICFDENINKALTVDINYDCKSISNTNTTNLNKIINNKNNKNVYNENDKIKENKLKTKGLESVDDLTRNILRNIFKKTTKIKKKNKNFNLNLLKNKIICNIFYEPSTRTRCSFSIASKKLGADVIDIDCNSSSVKKGESIEDFVKTIASLNIDLIVLRSDSKGFVNRAINALSNFKNQIPIINAGDGIGEHPTQALLDLYTIREKFGTVNDLTITFVGDLVNGRTVHSLAKLTSLYRIKINYLSTKNLKIPDDIYLFIKNKNIEQNIYFIDKNENENENENENIFKKLISYTDVLYMTRLQKERFTNENENENNYNYNLLKLTPNLLTHSKRNMIIMHPFPRNEEIDPLIDNDPRAFYFKQIENGLYVRMALLKYILKN
jgi:carbamoyl-phosphate synthase/aspartate carbamoyltransferase